MKNNKTEILLTELDNIYETEEYLIKTMHGISYAN